MADVQHWTEGYMIDRVLQSYRTYLEVRHPVKLRLFDRNFTSNPNGARAEAALFGLFRGLVECVSIFESPSAGGPDFLCEDSKGEFVVEVTTLNDEAIARAANWPNVVPSDADSTRSFTMVTDNLLGATRKKQRQLSATTVPRLLVIASEHIGASVLLSDYSAEALIVGDSRIRIDGVGSTSPGVDIATGLANSVFMKPAAGGQVSPARQSISAILLAALSDSGVAVIGALHPMPRIAFDCCHLPDVTFARLREWRQEPRTFEIDWVTCNPHSRTYALSLVELNDRELRGE